MKKIIIFLITCVNIYAQWEMVNPLPQGNRIDKIIFADSLHGWVNCRNNLLRTKDGGNTWELQTFDHFTGRSELFALNSEDLWLFHSDDLVERNRLYFSNNSGETWEEIILEDNIANTDYITDLIFLDSLVGYCSANIYFIFKTTDGGKTWEQQITPLPYRAIKSIDFINKKKGFAVGDFPLLYTTDGGETWSIDSTMLGGDFGIEGKEIVFLDSLNGYIVSHETIYRTTDGGENWAEHIVEENPDMSGKGDYIQYNITFLNNTNGWISTSWGLYETVDSGKTWLYIDSSSAFQDVVYLNENIGFAAIRDGILYDIRNELVRTVDGGLTWQKITGKFTDSILRGIDFIDDNNGWIVGSKSKIFSTIDGGITWKEHETILDSLELTDIDLNNVKFVNQQVGWVSSFDGVLLNTVDGGENWKIKIDNEKYIYYEIFLRDELNVWIGGREQTDNGYYTLLLNSIDGGNTWEKINLDWPSSVNGIYFNGNEGWVSTGYNTLDIDGAIFYTDDGGNSWQNIYTDLNVALGKMQFPTEEIGWISTGNHFLKTLDGGKTWQTKIRDVYLPIINFYFADENIGWTLSVLGVIAKTEDGGESWEIQRNPVSGFTLWDIEFVSTTWGLSVGDFGMIIKTENGGVTGYNTLTELSNKPNGFYLFQNYPNPFNPITIIEYSIPHRNSEFYPARLAGGSALQNVTLIVYDILGREVSTLVNEKQEAGSYSIVFNGSKLASGIYMVRLSYGNYVKTRKMLLLK